MQQVGLGRLRDAQAGAAVDKTRVQLGQLLGRQLHARALDPGDDRRLREHVADEAQQHVQQRNAQRADDDQRPGQQAQNEREFAEPALARIDPGIHWFLLLDAARRAGLFVVVVTPARVRGTGVIMPQHGAKTVTFLRAIRYGSGPGQPIRSRPFPFKIPSETS
ncbi:hypothetical protein D9M69_489210 [compost metagenome]